MKKVLKKILFIVLLILFIVVILFGINLFRNNYILNKIVQAYENDYSNKTNYYEKSDLKYTFIGNGNWNVINEIWVKDGIYLLKYTNQLIGDDTGKVEYTYWYNSVTGDEIIVDSEGKLSQEPKPKIEEFQTYIMRINGEGKKVYLAQNMFRPITIENGYYKIKQNNENYYLLVNIETNIIEKRINSENEVVWECNRTNDSVSDEDIIKPHSTDISLDTVLEDVI